MMFQKGIAGQRALARKTGASGGTINRLVHRVGRPSSETVRVVAKHLTDGDTDAVWEAVGTGHFDYGDFPITAVEDDLRLLTPKQRTSIIALIRAMADPDGKAGTEHVDSSAQKSDGGAEGVPTVASADKVFTPQKDQRAPVSDDT